jgi:hypothetical protein
MDEEVIVREARPGEAEAVHRVLAAAFRRPTRGGDGGHPDRNLAPGELAAPSFPANREPIGAPHRTPTVR